MFDFPTLIPIAHTFATQNSLIWFSKKIKIAPLSFISSVDFLNLALYSAFLVLFNIGKLNDQVITPMFFEACEGKRLAGQTQVLILLYSYTLEVCNYINLIRRHHQSIFRRTIVGKTFLDVYVKTKQLRLILFTRKRI